MSIKQPKLNEPPKIQNELSERELASPFISEKKIKGHTRSVYDCTTTTFPDGEDRIITCSYDDTLRFFNLEKQECEKIVNLESKNSIRSVHFFNEEEVLMTTGNSGKLDIWELFPKIKIIKKIKVSQPNTALWKLTQISSSEFICCVEHGNSIGNLYKIKFNKNNKNNNWISKEIEYPTYNNNEKKEDLNCVYQLISQKNIILFAGGVLKENGGEDVTIKSIDINNSNKFRRFPEKHFEYINCLTSFINSKNEEIILSGSYDEKIMLWSVKGEYLKEIEFDGAPYCFLNDFSRNNILIVGGWRNDMNIYSFSLNQEVLRKEVENVHTQLTYYMNWSNKENQNIFVTCSLDRTFNIYELEESCKEDIEKRFGFLHEIAVCQLKFKNKNICFWNTFTNEITEKEKMLKKFKQYETNINEKTILSIIGGEIVDIPYNHLPDYYFFFKSFDLKHCMAAINRKIEKQADFKNDYFLFKDFCLKYENSFIKSWFTTDLQKIEIRDFHLKTFGTSFALSLFNKMRKCLNDEIGLQMFQKDEYFAQVSYQIKKYKSVEIFEPINHKDFDGVDNKNELSSESFFKKLYENRSLNSNLILISTDKKEFKVHKEILILRFDFFFLLFRFRGAEITEYEKTGKITLVDLMSSDVVEVLLKYAYLGELNIKNEGIKTFETIIKVLIFCDQFKEPKLMSLTNSRLTKFIGNLKSPSAVLKEKETNEIKENILDILRDLSSYLDGNDRVLGIILPKLVDFGFGINDYAKGFLNQCSKMKDMMIIQEEKHEKEKVILEKEYEKKHLEEKAESENEKKRLRERILELEKLVGEIDESDDKGVGKGQLRERENDEEDEEIKKEQPKRKKRKINKK